MNSISDKTPLIPEIIANIIAVEALKICEVNVTELSSTLCIKAETIFQNNKNFQKKLKSSKGREWLYTFMDHWTGAYIIDNFSREKAENWRHLYKHFKS